MKFTMRVMAGLFLLLSLYVPAAAGTTVGKLQENCAIALSLTALGRSGE